MWCAYCLIFDHNNSEDDEPDYGNLCIYIDAVNISKFFSFAPHGHYLSLLHCNCRSLPNSYGDIMNLLLPVIHLPTTIAVTETWLTTANYDLFQMPNYTFFSQHRPTKGGGVGIYLTNSVSAFVRIDLSLLQPFIECVFVEVSLPDSLNILLGCVYRPPNTDITQFNAAITNTLNIISKKSYKTVAIAGDFNIDLLKNESHSPTNNFIDTFLSHSFLPAISIPTRITAHSQTLIDNIFVQSREKATKAAVIRCEISDHLPVAVLIKTKLPKAPK